MHRLAFVLLAAALGLGLTACLRRAPGEFQLPPGDAGRGRAAFIALTCYECHRVDGVADLPAPTAEPHAVVLLGGEVTRLRTYDGLVTSVIHPAQSISERMLQPVGAKISQSPMPAVNDRMTVAQLVDVVTFLLPRYRQIELPATPIPLYPPLMP